MNGLKSKLENILGIPSARFEENNKDELHLAVTELEFEQVIRVLSEKELALLGLFAVESFNSNGFALFYVFEKKGYADFLVIRREVAKQATSIAEVFPSACWYEREIADGFGIGFNGAFDSRRLFLHEAYPKDFHPLLKSFANGAVKAGKEIPAEEEYKFKEVKGESVYQIPVGPVHAGIIEPGHFRFSAIGETILNLEVRMFWKHRGIEKLAEGKRPEEALPLAEAISGDETIANALAYCMAVEKISQIKVPLRAQCLRMLMAEMERIYSLLGDLAGMVVDIAYPAGASPFFILREEILRWNERLSGSRFLKNALQIGGVKQDANDMVLSELKAYLKTFSQRLKQALHQSLSFTPVLDRLRAAGAVKKELVRPLNLSGPLARASGYLADVRISHPYCLYSKITPNSKVLDKGDVLSRFKIKAATIEDSAAIIHEVMGLMPKGEIKPESLAIKDGHALMMVESARGQNLHWLLIHNGEISRYKIRTASFCNWQAIEHAVMGNIVPDFPLINKSMNLSYAGTDL